MTSQKTVQPKTALISVSDKTGLVPFARFLQDRDIKIIATGGTAKKLLENDIKVSKISSLTKFPEIFGGRVKSIHPNIVGGILGQREKDRVEAKKNNIRWIDLVVCNLYPFEKIARNPKSLLDEKIENIDIGGPTMIRAAAKNNKWVSVIVSPKNYHDIKKSILSGGTTQEQRLNLAVKAFEHCSNYDKAIFESLGSKKTTLRYGENPHQKAHVINNNQKSFGLPQAKKLQGKKLSYNNFLDGEAAMLCLNEFKTNSCVIVKHNSPCGIGSGLTSKESFNNALRVDRLSAFGGIVALNRRCTIEAAKEIQKIFFEIIIAPSFDKAALDLFSKKKNLRILQLKNFVPNNQMVRNISGGVLAQDVDLSKLQPSDLTNPTKKKPTTKQLVALQMAWKAVKHAKSNAIVVAHNNKIVSISGGQTSRVEAVKYALTKNKLPKGCVVASDAFFPFRDSIDLMAKHGISAIVQPGGSIKDADVIDACNEHKMSMVFTSFRVFKH